MQQKIKKPALQISSGNKQRTQSLSDFLMSTPSFFGYYGIHPKTYSDIIKDIQRRALKDKQKR